MELFQINDTQHPLFIFIAVLIGLASMFNNNVTRKVAFDFTNKTFLMYLSIIALFSFIVFRQETKTEKQKNFKQSVGKALGALVVAYFSHLDLVFAPFFLVFAGDYFLNGLM